MNFDIKNIESMKLYNRETNEEVMDITGGFTQLDYMISDGIKLNANTSVEINSKNCFIEENFGKFFNQKIGQVFEVEMDIPQYVQARRHKNKRINKKWMKRYGLKIIHKKRRAKVTNIKTEDYSKNYLGSTTFEFDLEMVNK